MRIRMLHSFAGVDFAVSVNEETDRFSDAEAARMIDAGYAAPVASPEAHGEVKEPQLPDDVGESQSSEEVDEPQSQERD